MSQLKIFQSGDDGEWHLQENDNASGASAGASAGATEPSDLHGATGDMIGAEGTSVSETRREITGFDAMKVKHFFESDLIRLQTADDISVTSTENIGSLPTLVFTTTSTPTRILDQRLQNLQNKVNTLHEDEILIGDRIDEAKKLLKSLVSENILLYASEQLVCVCGTDYVEVQNVKRKFQEKMGMGPAPSSRAERRFNMDTSDRKPDNINRTSSLNSSFPTSSTTDWSFNTPNGLLFKCYKHAITKIQCDAVVNAANDVMMHGGGVAEAIAKAAGYKLVDESLKYVKDYGEVKVTENCVTTGGSMPCKYVIHAVGPKWHDYHRKEDCLKDLCLTVEKVLKQADRRQLKVIIMTAISAGIFGVPKQLCAEMYIKSVTDYKARAPSSSVKELHFVDIKDDILLEVRRAYEKWLKDPQSLQPERAVASGSWSQGRTQDFGWRNKHDQYPKYQQGVSSTKLCFQFGSSRNLSIYIYAKDITELSVSDNISAIVSTEDKQFGTIGGVSRAIMNAASRGGDGLIYKQEITKNKQSKSVFAYGEMFITSAGSLLVRKVFHVICPSVSMSNSVLDRANLLKTVTTLLKQVDKNGTDSIAMPLPGSGLIEEEATLLTKCCQTVFQAIQEFADSAKNLKEVHIVSLHQSTNETLGKQFQNMSKKCKNVWQKSESKEQEDWDKSKFSRHQKGNN